MEHKRGYSVNSRRYWYFDICGSASELLGSRTCDQLVAGSNPSCHAAEYNLEQVVYTHASITKQYHLILANGSAAGEVTTGLMESNGSLLPALWLRSPVGRLPRTRISSGTLRSFRVWDYLTFTVNGTNFAWQ